MRSSEIRTLRYETDKKLERAVMELENSDFLSEKERFWLMTIIYELQYLLECIDAKDRLDIIEKQQNIVELAYKSYTEAVKAEIEETMKTSKFAKTTPELSTDSAQPVQNAQSKQIELNYYEQIQRLVAKTMASLSTESPKFADTLLQLQMLATSVQTARTYIMDLEKPVPEVVKLEIQEYINSSILNGLELDPERTTKVAKQNFGKVTQEMQDRQMAKENLGKVTQELRERQKTKENLGKVTRELREIQKTKQNLGKVTQELREQHKSDKLHKFHDEVLDLFELDKMQDKLDEAPKNRRDSDMSSASTSTSSSDEASTMRGKDFAAELIRIDSEIARINKKINEISDENAIFGLDFPDEAAGEICRYRTELHDLESRMNGLAEDIRTESYNMKSEGQIGNSIQEINAKKPSGPV